MTTGNIDGIIRGIKTVRCSADFPSDFVLLATAIIIASLSAKAEDGTAEDLGDVMSISLKDVVKTTLADQCARHVANAGSGVFGGLAYANQKLSDNWRQPVLRRST